MSEAGAPVWPAVDHSAAGTVGISSVAAMTTAATSLLPSTGTIKAVKYGGSNAIAAQLLAAGACEERVYTRTMVFKKNMQL